MTLLRADLDRNDRPSADSETGDMVAIPGGTFRVGSDHHYPEEAPVHRVTVEGFRIDRTPVEGSTSVVYMLGEMQVAITNFVNPF